MDLRPVTDPWFAWKAFWSHLRNSGDRHSVHSPFVARLISDVLRRPPARPAFIPIERLRRAALANNSRLRITDLGAGSRTGAGAERSIRSIARAAAKSPLRARTLHALARHQRATHILELGTSLGFTTLYLAQATPTGQVVTIEGCPAIRAVAQDHFKQLGTTNIHSLQGAFQEQLPAALQRLGRLDMAFVDGHHAGAPTWAYFEQLMVHAHEGTVLVMDDIHWSPDMERTWEMIKADDRVTVTVDLFDIGLVFLRKGQAKEHFRLRY